MKKKKMSGVEALVSLIMMLALWIIVGHLLDIYLGRWAMWIMVCLLLVRNINSIMKSK